jgi:hypothetical protein
VAFLVAGDDAAGLPPFSGFVGKLMLLTTLREVAAGPAIWVVVLISGFVVMIALARDGCPDLEAPGSGRAARPQPSHRLAAGDGDPAAGRRRAAAGVGARPLADYAARTAANCMRPAPTSPAFSDQPAKTGHARHAMMRQDPAAAAAVADGLSALGGDHQRRIAGLLLLGALLAVAVPLADAILLAEPAASRPALARRCVFSVSLRSTSSPPTGASRARSSVRCTGCRRPSSKCRSICATRSSPPCSAASSR